MTPWNSYSQKTGNQTFTLQRRGDIQVNPVLLHVLKTEHGCEIDPEELLPETSQEDEWFDPTPIYDQLKKATDTVKGFAIKESAHISHFYYQKMTLVEELSTCATQIAAHDLIAAIAGDKKARDSIRQRVTEINPRQFDKIPPQKEFLILDADSSQQRVITAVLSGQHGVIQGPPGTGKSQTIANLIAALTAKGRRVLFVAEKRAALEVVYRRLEQTGLGHLALDLHGTISRRQIMERLGEALTEVHHSITVDAKETHRIFTARRQSLNEHVTGASISWGGGRSDGLIPQMG
jgi:primosomal protein N'